MHRIKSSWELHLTTPRIRKIRNTNQMQWDYEAGDDFEMKRSPSDDFAVEFNYKQLLVIHSPTGMEFGYLGSGCSDNAANILLNCISGGTGLVTEDEEDLIKISYQDFKAEFIGPMDRKGGVINYSTVVDYLKSRGWEVR